MKIVAAVVTGVGVSTASPAFAEVVSCDSAGHYEEQTTDVNGRAITITRGIAFDWAAKQEGENARDPVWQHAFCDTQRHVVIWCLPSDEVSPECAALGTTSNENPLGFRMPSGNIQCEIAEWVNTGENKTGFELTCSSRSIVSHPNSEGGCDKFTGFSLDEEGTYVSSSCDTRVRIDNSLPILSYGETWRFGKFVCKSDRNGVICRNAHVGFLLSQARQIEF
jgi:hypothetical protein